MKTVLPDIIQDEIFCLSSRVSDVVIDHLCSDIEQFEFVIRNVTNYDCSIIIDLVRESQDSIPHTHVNLRIDRIFRIFEITAEYGDEMVLPRIGDWDGTLDYLEKLSNGI